MLHLEVASVGHNGVGCGGSRGSGGHNGATSGISGALPGVVTIFASVRQAEEEAFDGEIDWYFDVKGAIVVRDFAERAVALEKEARKLASGGARAGGLPHWERRHAGRWVVVFRRGQAGAEAGEGRFFIFFVGIVKCTCIARRQHKVYRK